MSIQLNGNYYLINMIFVEKRGRFGNFLFQYFLAKLIQSKTKKKIIVFSKNENKNLKQSNINIDKIITKHVSLPKFSFFLNLWKKKTCYVNDDNYKYVLNNIQNINPHIFYLDGFFHDIDIINNNINILNQIISNPNSIDKKKDNSADLTIHIRHLQEGLTSIDNHPLYSEQPNLDLYKKIIDISSPKKIKVICEVEDNEIFKNLKNLYKDRISYKQKNEIDDFYDIVNSKNLILANSTFSIWGGLFSNCDNIYIPDIGVLKKILNKRKLNIKSKLIYL